MTIPYPGAFYPDEAYPDWNMPAILSGIPAYPGVAYPGATFPLASAVVPESSIVGPDGAVWELVGTGDVDYAGARSVAGLSRFSAKVEGKAGESYPLSLAGVDIPFRGPYFDGDTPPADFSTAWEGTAEQSTTALRAASVSGADDGTSGHVVAVGSFLWASTGSKSMRLIPTSRQGDDTGVVLDLPDIPNGVHTIRATILIDGPVSGQPYIRVGTTEKLVPATPGVHEAFVTFQKSPDITTFTIGHGGVWSDADVYVDDLAVQAGTQRSFYWGEDDDGIDFTHDWEGAPNASPTLKTSHRNALHVEAIDSIPVQSSAWRQNAYYSLRIINNHSVNPGRVKIIDLADLTPGQTYTAIGVVRSEFEMPGIGFPYKSISFEAGNQRSSDASTVKIGVDMLAVSFVVPEDETEGGVYLYNGGVQGDPDVWWDSVIITDGVERPAYFDGDRRGYEWMGEPHASSSRRLPVPFKSGGWPLKKFYSAMGDVLGEVDELIARFTYFSKDEQDQAVLFGHDLPDREVPLGQTSDLVDPRTANPEWLNWIGTMTGVKVENYTDTDELRRAVLEADSGYKAGSRESLVSSVKTVMSGPWEEREVQIIPNTSDPNDIGGATIWDLLIITRGTNAPSSEDLLAAVARSGSKPAGIRLHHATFEATWENVEAAFPTWAHWEGKTWLQIEDSRPTGG